MTFSPLVASMAFSPPVASSSCPWGGGLVLVVEVAVAVATRPLRWGGDDGGVGPRRLIDGVVVPCRFVFYFYQYYLLRVICTHDTSLLWARASTHGKELFVVNLFIMSTKSNLWQNICREQTGFIMSIELTSNPGFPIVLTTFVLSVVGQTVCWEQTEVRREYRAHGKPRVSHSVNDVCAFSGRWLSHRQRDACGDFVSLEDLSVQSSKMLLGVGLHTCVHRDECACVVSVSVVLCNSKKTRWLFQI
jgi:hypothetical protein